MDRDEALDLLRKGGLAMFNAYRAKNPHWIPDFTGADLSRCDLVGEGDEPANLDGAILFGAVLPVGDFLTFRGSSVSLQGAFIDAHTSGPDIDILHTLGAQFATKDQVSKRKEFPITQIFISYAWANSKVVSAIEHWLRQKGLNTKIDKRDFFAGSRIRDEIMRLMGASEVVLVFHSIESKDKPWIEFERELVADLQMSAKKKTRCLRGLFML